MFAKRAICECQGCCALHFCHQKLRLSAFAGHGGWVADAALAPGGGSAVTASGDELAVVWNLATGTAVNVLAGHAGEVRSVVLTRRGRCWLHVLLQMFIISYHWLR